jgi:SanA protein
MFIKKKNIKAIIIIISLFIISFFTINIYINLYYKKYIYSTDKAPKTQAALVLGAYVHGNGKRSVPSTILKDRLNTAFELYKKGKIKKFILSGDHGNHEYDEVNAMKNYLLRKKIPANNIFLDHAGFSTYDSIVRAKKIFQVSSMTIISQNYHLRRALFIARAKNIKAFGVQADKRRYFNLKYYKLRELFSNIKNFCYVIFNVKPKYLGKPIPITGKSKKSWD